MADSMIEVVFKVSADLGDSAPSSNHISSSDNRYLQISQWEKKCDCAATCQCWVVITPVNQW